MMTPPDDSPLYQQVLDVLRKEIASGRYDVGEKLPSEADLVKRFGASRITIGRAMRELQNLDLVERKAGSGTYVRPPKTSDLTFGLLIPNLGQTEIFEPICQGMGDASRSAQHALLWGNAAEPWQLCLQYIERRVSGVFFAPMEFTAKAMNLEIAAALEHARIPMVLLDRCYLPFPERSGHDLVGVDNRRVGYIATNHLIELGCSRIAFVALPGTVSSVEARIAGYREALQHGNIHGPDLVKRFVPVDPETVKKFMDSAKPQGIVCANDRTASSLMRSLLDLGYRIPGQVRLVGIDDLPFASLLPVPLTTVHQPGREIGLVAMSTMLDRLANPYLPTRDVLLGSHLVVRSSCGGAAISKLGSVKANS